MSILFKPTTLGDLKLKNRVVMAPMTRSRSIGNVPDAMVAEYYAQRAGAGLIITEGTSPAPEGLGYPRIPGAYTDEQQAGWRLVTDAVHDKGGVIFLQLMHTGRVSHPDNLPPGAFVLAPSAIGLKDTQMYTDKARGVEPMPVPTEMDAVQIQGAINSYVESAKGAIASGFDGVELHGANGYLIEQFLNPNINKRTDAFGGTDEKRMRFALDVVDAVSEAIGAGRVGIRISPYGVFNETGEFEGIDAFYEAFASQLSERGIAHVHMVDHSSQGAPPVPDSVKDAVRKAFGGAYILSGGYDKERAEADLKAKKGDLVAFGRPFIANPDLVHRMKAGIALSEPKDNLMYTPGPHGYTDYPAAKDA